ncbi:MAG: UDP-3-O-(3-hydroxymyristoyl)glucosamine N-acyltransferase [Gammaproteobacteria bacterium]
MVTVASLARQLGANYTGDGNIELASIATLQNAGEGCLSFLASSQYRRYLATTNASAVILGDRDAANCPVTAIVCENPYSAYADAARLFEQQPQWQQGVHPSVIVDPLVGIDSGCSIGANTVIEGDVRIGKNTRLGVGCFIGSGVSIGQNCILNAGVTVLTGAIGDRVVIKSGAVIGSDGFGFVRLDDGWKTVPQLGSVIIGNDVSIGANSTIDRGAIDPTLIGDGVKIDNQVQIAHNVVIGEHTVIAGCVGISGSAIIGAYCQLAGGVGIVGHLEIADHVTITGMSMVTHSIKRAGIYSSGTPIMPNTLWRKTAVRLKHLDKYFRSIAKEGKVKGTM